MWGDQALKRFIAELEPGSLIADIGSGKGEQARIMRDAGLDVVEFDLGKGTDYMQSETEIHKFDGVWCCHVAEHILNLHNFLIKIRTELKPGGLLAITVPPPKHQIVGGHVNLFNPGLLLYRLVIAGFDCSMARLGVYGYNISVIVRKRLILEVFEHLVMDQGDLQKLDHMFPFHFDGDNFNGNLTHNIGW